MSSWHTGAILGTRAGAKVPKRPSKGYHRGDVHRPFASLPPPPRLRRAGRASSHMFTGIIESTAAVLQRTPSSLTIERPSSFHDLKIGSSISVSGACLSVVALTKTSMQFDVVPETLKKSRLGTLKQGERVNLERAMRAGDRFEGHIVQGHVEGVGIVITPSPQPPPPAPSVQGEGGVVVLRVPKDLQQSIIPKGSICLDGVSLTIAKIDGDQLTVALIPHTLKNTTLGSLKKGDRVNVETDVMMRSALT